MLSEEDFKYKYLQQPITFLTEENLDELETHCRKAVNFERGVEHKVVLELLERYYQYQKEIRLKNNNITKLEKENKEKDKQIDLMAEWIFDKDYRENSLLIHRDDYYSNCIKQVKKHFEKLAKEKGE